MSAAAIGAAVPNGLDAPRALSSGVMNPLKRLTEFGQSVYLDEIRRSWLTDGTLKRLIDDDGLRGVTSNPAIFHKAITQSSDYDAAVAKLAAAGLDAAAAYEELVVADIKGAADLFRAQHDASGGVDGYVSLEVSPELAHDAEGTLAEARHLWGRLGRPNVFIKVPGTDAGLVAIEQLIAEGINVNVTLLFGMKRYRQVIEAYLAGLERRLANGEDVRGVQSVASFFLSRIDVLIDPRLDAMGGGAQSLRGKAAIASAKLAYQLYLEEFGALSARFARLSAAGAATQRLLWASTGTKDPSYSDVKYVEPLVGSETINTLPLETLDAYRDHGDPADRISDGVEEAHADVKALAARGIDLDEVSDQLEAEGVDKFVKPFRQLLAGLEEALRKAVV